MFIALAQLCSTPDIPQNLATCRRLLTQAVAHGAQWVLFPENAPYLGRDRDKLAVAQTLEGEMVTAFQEMAKTSGCWVTLGSFPEVSKSPDHTYNTQVQISPEGEICAVYRKIHLFDVTLPSGGELKESGSILPGEELVCTSLGPWQVGLSICYDLRFPELYRALVDKGAQVLTVPSAFTQETGQAHWHTLLRARAIENQCYVVAPNQWGEHLPGRVSYGQSVIIDPWGGRLACAAEGEGLAFATLDLEGLERVRRRMPCLGHRRLK